METYQFILRFDDADHQLTAHNGLGINEVSDLLASLSKAIKSSDTEKVVLSDIRGNCYALELTTSSVIQYESLKIVHRKIQDSDFHGMTSDEKGYVTTLKSIIEAKGYNFKAYSESKDFIISIDEIIMPNEPTQYFEVGSIYGIMTSIGSKGLDGVASIDVSGIPYKVKVSQAQEKQLYEFYKKGRIRFVVRRRVKIEDDETERVVDAELESFEPLLTDTLATSIQKLRSSKTKLFPRVKDSVKTVRKLRDNP